VEKEKKKFLDRNVPKGEDNMSKGMLVFGCITSYFAFRLAFKTEDLIVHQLIIEPSLK
jgi:hypothetical protein